MKVREQVEFSATTKGVDGSKTVNPVYPALFSEDYDYDYNEVLMLVVDNKNNVNCL